MRATRVICAGLLLSIASGLVACRSPNVIEAPAASNTVLLVCEHGSVKSLMAASLFNRMATDRGLPFRAISRGVAPDTSVPPKIAEALARDGFKVDGFKPARVSRHDLEHALHVVTIEADLPPLAQDAALPIEAWNDVPAASVDYVAARDSLQQHISALLDNLQAVKR